MKLVIIQKSEIHEYEDSGDLFLTEIIFIFISVKQKFYK